jgi:hypothetical protein
VDRERGEVWGTYIVIYPLAMTEFCSRRSDVEISRQLWSGHIRRKTERGAVLLYSGTCGLAVMD